MTRLRRATRGALSDARPGYQLTAITCDLVAFDAHLAAAAATDNPVEQREQLTAGLAWVTGPPFSGPAGDWRWVDKDTLALAAAASTGHPGDLKTEWAAVTGRYRGQGQEPDPELARRYPPP